MNGKLYHSQTFLYANIFHYKNKNRFDIIHVHIFNNIKYTHIYIYLINRIKQCIKYDTKISREINGWIAIHAANAWRGNTTCYLAIRGMYTSCITVCVRPYTVRLFCFNRSKFAHSMTHPLTQAFQLTQPLTSIYPGTHSHYHPLTHLHIQF